MIAIGDRWLVRRFGGLWLSRLKLGLLMTGEPLHSTQPCHLGCPHAAIPRCLPLCNLGRRSTLIIPHWARGGGFTVLRAGASALSGEDWGRRLHLLTFFSAHGEWSESKLCFSDSSPDYAPVLASMLENVVWFGCRHSRTGEELKYKCSCISQAKVKKEINKQKRLTPTVDAKV